MWLRLLVGQFVQQAAAQKMRSVVTDTLRSEIEKQQSAGSEPPLPCDVCFIFGTNAEAGALTDLLSDSVYAQGVSFVERRGTLDGRQIVVAEVGIGVEAAAQGTADCIAIHRPRWVISAGFASGLTPELKKGHIVMADELVDLSGRALSVGLKPDPASVSPALHIGRLLTTDHAVHEPEEKRVLAERHRAIACDMETMAIAQVCRALSVPLISIRVISETVDDRLPPEIERLLEQPSLVRKLGTATGAILNRFSAIGDLWQLYEDGLKCSQRLAKFLRSTLSQLPRSDSHDQ